MRRLVSIPILILLYMYRYSLGLLLRRHCRFYPSCSGYAIEAVKTHGAWHGIFLAVKRISRCHPGHPGGHDPVPGRRNEGGSTNKAKQNPHKLFDEVSV